MSDSQVPQLPPSLREWYEMNTIDFGDVRALLNVPYSRPGWEQLCHWVTTWEAHTYKETLLPYLLGHLHTWEDTRRVVPKSWLDSLISARPVQGMEIVRALNLSSWTRQRHLRDAHFPRTLFENVQLRHLTHIDLSDNVFDHDTINAMTMQARFDEMRTLRLARLECGEELDGELMLSELFYASWWTQLEELDLSFLPFDPAPLFERVEMPSLHTLCLRGTPAPESLRALGTSYPYTPLRSLDLSMTGGVLPPHLIALTPFDGVTHLNVSQSRFDPSSLRCLGELPLARTLERLDLWRCELSAAELGALLKAWPGGCALRSLDLSRNRVDSTMLHMLLEHPLLAQLEELDLFGCVLDDELLELVIHFDGFAPQTRVNLRGNNASATLVDEIAAQPHLRATFLT